MIGIIGKLLFVVCVCLVDVLFVYVIGKELKRQIREAEVATRGQTTMEHLIDAVLIAIIITCSVSLIMFNVVVILISYELFIETLNWGIL